MRRKFTKLGMLIGFCLIFPTVFTLFFSRTNRPVENNISSGKTIIINSGSQTINMDMEDFIPCVLVNQLSIDAPAEALKAQAVVIRTYILNIMGKETDINAKELKLPFTLYEDLRNIAGEQYSEYHAKLKAAAKDTMGQTIRYNGNLITPYFHSISAGMTRNSSEALSSDTLPYLVSVKSPYDTSSENYISIIYMEKADFVNALKKYNEDIAISNDNPLESCQVLNRCSAGYISSIQLGNLTFTGDEVQKIFSLASPYFEIENYENQIRIICKGNGHGLGLSIFGSIAMANEGKTYLEILTHYYTGVTVE